MPQQPDELHFRIAASSVLQGPEAVIRESPALMENSASSAPGDSPPVSGRRPVMTTSGFPVLLVSATSSPFALSLQAGSALDQAGRAESRSAVMLRGTPLRPTRRKRKLKPKDAGALRPANQLLLRSGSCRSCACQKRRASRC
jgi:hypothetical protein